MNTSIIGSTVNSAALAAVTVPADPGSWESLGWMALSALLGTVLSWLSNRFK